MKKKFYVLLMTAAFATTSFAQSPTKGLAVKADPDQPLITEQPAGTLYANYYGESAGYAEYFHSPSFMEMDATVHDFVVNDKGEVYLQNAVASYLSNTWIRDRRQWEIRLCSTSLKSTALSRRPTICIVP